MIVINTQIYQEKTWDSSFQHPSRKPYPVKKGDTVAGDLLPDPEEVKNKTIAGGSI